MSSEYFDGVNRPLEAAIADNSRIDIVKALSQGAAVNARGRHNVTPLMLAVDGQKGNAVAELLARGANPNLLAEDGASAVSLAVENYRVAPDILDAIMRGGGDPNMRRPDKDPVIVRFINDHDCAFIRKMKEYGANLDMETRGGDPLITMASTTRSWEIVWCFIELGAQYDYERTSRRPLSRSLAASVPAPDSPIYPYKRKVWEFFKAHGIAVAPLPE